MFSQKGLLFSSSRHFKLNLAWGLLVHRVEFWSHTHKTSGLCWKILRGGFSCFPFHLELRLRLAFLPSVFLPVKGSYFSIGPHWVHHRSRILTYTWLFYIYMFLVACSLVCLVILDYKLLLEYLIKFNVWESWSPKFRSLSSREDLLLKRPVAWGPVHLRTLEPPLRNPNNHGVAQISFPAAPPTSPQVWALVSVLK